MCESPAVTPDSAFSVIIGTKMFISSLMFADSTETDLWLCVGRENSTSKQEEAHKL